MGKPVIEQIAVVIFSRLTALADKYDVTTNLADAVRPTKQGGFTPQDKQIELMEGEEDTPVVLPGNPPKTERVQTFLIQARAMPSEKDTAPIGKLINEMKADIIKAIGEPTASWHKFGDKAINANWGVAEIIPPGGEFRGVTIPLMVRYRTEESNPYVMVV